MTTYSTLPDFDDVIGLFSFTLYSDFAGLTVPSIQTVLEIGDTEESADLTIGLQQLSTLKMELRDDYTTYTTYGFWFKVLTGETQLRIYLNQGAGNTFYFFGTVQAETVQWTERYISSTEKVRVVTFDLVSMAQKLLDTPTIDWVTAVIANSVNSGAEVDLQPSYGIKVLGLFSAMLSASGLNSSYALADTSFIYGTADFIFTGSKNVGDLTVAVKMFVAPASHAVCEYWSGSGILSNSFATLKDVLAALLPNFGVVLRMTYDISSGRHLIHLTQRGRAYSNTLDFEDREKESEISKATDLIGDAVRAVFFPTDTEFVWFSKKTISGFSEAAVPNYVSFDADYLCLFECDGPVSGLTISRSLWFVSGTTWAHIIGVQYYNYSTSAYITATSNYEMLEAMAGYQFYRISNQYSAILRTYSKLRAGAGTDHTVLNIYRRTNINDGLATNAYFANRVIKKPSDSKVTIEWILEE